ncbi:MAG: class I SAM-dependent methyltransferase [Candidatus Hodarchaeota archaeon]
MEVPKIEKVIDTKEIYNYIATLNFPAMHAGGSQATKELVAMCNLTENTLVLDVGCGTGSTACLITKKYGSQVIGVDLSENMIMRAKERAKKHKVYRKLEFRVEDVYQLSFSDGKFDLVLFESVITPLSNEKQALKEIRRVTRPGGLIAGNEGIFDPSTPSEVFELLAKHPSFRGIFLSSNRLKEIFEELDLEILQFTEKKFTMNLLKEMGIGGLISFMLKSYPKLVYKLITDSQFREYQKIDDKVNKVVKDYASCVLFLLQKP